jgi:hypothetical protein
VPQCRHQRINGAGGQSRRRGSELGISGERFGARPSDQSGQVREAYSLSHEPGRCRCVEGPPVSGSQRPPDPRRRRRRSLRTGGGPRRLVRRLHRPPSAPSDRQAVPPGRPSAMVERAIGAGHYRGHATFRRQDRSLPERDGSLRRPSNLASGGRSGNAPRRRMPRGAPPLPLGSIRAPTATGREAGQSAAECRPTARRPCSPPAAWQDGQASARFVE